MDSAIESTGDRSGFDVRRVTEPLAQASSWMRVVGGVMIAQGALTALTIVGLIWCWMPIWMGVLLFQTAGAADRARDANDAIALHEAHTKLKKLFTIGGVVAILSVMFTIGYFILLFGLGFSDRIGPLLEDLR